MVINTFQLQDSRALSKSQGYSIIFEVKGITGQCSRSLTYSNYFWYFGVRRSVSLLKSKSVMLSVWVNSH